MKKIINIKRETTEKPEIFCTSLEEVKDLIAKEYGEVMDFWYNEMHLKRISFYLTKEDRNSKRNEIAAWSYNYGVGYVKKNIKTKEEFGDFPL